MMERALGWVELVKDEVEAIFQEAFGKGKLGGCEPLSGGAVNSTYKMVWDGIPYVLRLYVRDPEFAEVEQGIFQLIHGKVPAPRLFHMGRGRYPFGIFEFIDKKHISEAKGDAENISYALGKTLSQIHSIHFPKAGLFGKQLTIQTPFEEGSSPYLEYILEHLTQSSQAWKRLGDQRALRLLNFLDKNRHLFPVMEQGGVLVHSDFKPVNLLWDAQTGLSVLDWEFAHSGHPLLDCAILMRHITTFPFDQPSFEKGYGTLPEDWVRKARATDLINCVQLLDSPADQPRLYQSLLHSIDETIN